MSLQIQLKKSAVSQKQPFASDLAIGELALNYNANGPFLTCKDSAGNVRKLNNVWVATAAPNNPSAGDLWLDTSAATAVLKVYKDSTSTWVNATTIPVATTTIFGTVQLASAADITNATAGKVVDAAQLQSKISAQLSANPITFQGVNVVNNVTIGGDLTVNGTQTIINTTTLDVEDKNIVIGNVATPSNTTADGGGISLLGATTKTLNWVNATGAWTSSERFSVPVGSAAAPSLTFTGDTNTGIYSPGEDQLALVTNGTGRLFVDSSGRILAGVSSTSVTATAVLQGNSFSSTAASVLFMSRGGLPSVAQDNLGLIRFGDNSQNLGAEIQATAEAAWTAGASYPSALAFRTTASGTTAAAERLRITSDGKVGVGISSPQGVLHTYVNATYEPSLTFNSGSLILSTATAVQLAQGVSNNSPFPYWLQVRDSGNASRPLALNPSGGNVGVGTASPSQLLHVNGNAVVGGSPATQYSNFTVAGTSGIQSATPLLNFVNAAGSTRFGYIYHNGTGGNIDIINQENGGLTFGTNNTERARLDSSGTFRVKGAGTAGVNDAFAVNGSAPANSAQIDSSGRLLVGTSSARSTYLGVAISAGINVEAAGNLGASNRAISVVNGFAGSTDGDAIIYLGRTRSNTVGGTTVVQNGDNIGRIEFVGSDGTNMLSCARIIAFVDDTPGANDMPGRLVFSTTANGESGPTERMRITSGGVLRTFSSDGNTLDLASNKAAGTTDNLILGRYSGTGVDTGTASFAVRTNGNVVNTNNSYGAISDAKLKENIVDANSQWSDIKALQVRKYNFKEGQTHTQIGLVAQEVELVSPGLVTESPDRDKDGNELGTTTKSVNYSVLYMKAVKALQEAMERIETLEAKVAALESA